MKIFLPLLRNVSFGVAGFVAIAYLALCLVIYARQTRMIFFPSATIESTPEDFNLTYEDVWVPVGNPSRGERLHGWWIPSSERAQNQGARVVLHLHGNGENIGANVAQAARLHDAGLSVLLIDYRGYGRSSSGFPTEAKVYQDAEAAWQYLINDRNVPSEQIFLYGHSLGGAIAIQLATQHPNAAGLIVESTFTSMRDMAYRTTPYGFLPVDLILTQKFDSITKVASVFMPLLIIHGTADIDIPYDMSQTLYAAAAQPKTLWIVPGADHNNVAITADASYEQMLKSFVQRSSRLAQTSHMFSN